MLNIDQIRYKDDTIERRVDNYLDHDMIVNGKLKRGTFALHHSTGNAVAYAIPKVGSRKCTISAPKARRYRGTLLSSTKETSAGAAIYQIIHFDYVNCLYVVSWIVRNSFIGSCDFVTS